MRWKKEWFQWMMNTGLSLETENRDLFRMRKSEEISSRIILIITNKLYRGSLPENCCY